MWLTGFDGGTVNSSSASCVCSPSYWALKRAAHHTARQRGGASAKSHTRFQRAAMRNAIQGLGVDEKYETKFDAIADFLLVKAKIVAALLEPSSHRVWGDALRSNTSGGAGGVPCASRTDGAGHRGHPSPEIYRTPGLSASAKKVYFYQSGTH